MNAFDAVRFAARNFRYCPGTGNASIAVGWEPVGAQSPLIIDGNAIELRVAHGRAVLCCRISTFVEDLPQIRRFLGRMRNDQRSVQVIAGLVLLLASCGWVIGGEAGARALIANATPPQPSGTPPAVDFMRQHFGARRLYPSAMPHIFEILADLSRRAGLSRQPDLYLIVAPDKMNAYDLGGSEASAIALTEGLLRGMQQAEIAAILAHEIAHIRANDAWTMSFAASLQRAIASAAVAGLGTIGGGQPSSPAGPLQALLCYAPAMARLLCLGLSRIREHDADAMALELTGDPQALVAALAKLERHHNGSLAIPAPPDEYLLRYLRTHPRTHDRVGMLLNFMI